MSRNNFNLNIPDNKRPSKSEVIDMLTPVVGESLANEFADNNMPEPSDVGVLKPCEDDTAQYPKTNFIPPAWYRIENGK